MPPINWIAFGSIATAVVVIINLVILFFIPRRKRPKLSIEFDGKEPFCRVTIAPQGFVRISNGFVPVTPTHWIRVKVRSTGMSVARHCVGKLVSVWDESGKGRTDFDPTQLHWVSTDWIEVPFHAIDLGRGDYEYLDVLAIQAIDKKMNLAGDQFPLAAYKPRGIISTLKPGKYVLAIAAYGDDIEPITKYLGVIWRGNDIQDIEIKLHSNINKAESYLRKHGPSEIN